MSFKVEAGSYSASLHFQRFFLTFQLEGHNLVLVYVRRNAGLLAVSRWSSCAFSLQTSAWSVCDPTAIIGGIGHKGRTADAG